MTPSSVTERGRETCDLRSSSVLLAAAPRRLYRGRNVVHALEMWDPRSVRVFNEQMWDLRSCAGRFAL